MYKKKTMTTATTRTTKTNRDITPNGQIDKECASKTKHCIVVLRKPQKEGHQP